MALVLSVLTSLSLSFPVRATSSVWSVVVHGLRVSFRLCYWQGYLDLSDYELNL